MNIDTAKSYKTEANLAKGLEAAGLGDSRSLTVCNRAGRFTAIFPMGWNDLAPVAIAQAGFFIVS